MFRGSTPTLYFNIKNVDDMSTISEVQISIKSSNNLLVKGTSDVIIDDENHIIMLDLTQEETLEFKALEAQVQIKLLFNDDKVAMSQICSIPIENPINPSVIKETPEESAEEE